MGANEAVEKYTELLDVITQLTSISEEQQQSLIDGDMMKLSDAFAARKVLMERLQNTQQQLDGILASDSALQKDERVKLQKVQLEHAVHKFLHVDTVLNTVLERHINAIGTRLVELGKFRSAIAQYKHVVRSTDVFAQVFQGNSRRFNENR